jgi:hypothetical protein
MELNKPVDFPTAKLLKEKEFDSKTHMGYVYFQNTRQYELISHRESKDYPAPTIAEVVCWIYTKYNIWIQISILKDNEWHYSIRRKENNWEIEFPTKEKFSSIEKAYEKGIEIVLNTYSPTS